MILHWILNPGIAFNELVLGQRLPRLVLIDKTSPAPLMERQYVPCPACGALNDGRVWSGSNAFGHWFGYICPECGGRIPCHWNVASLVLLAVTFPVWAWIKPFAERRWLEREKRRLEQCKHRSLPEAKDSTWLRMGMLFGMLMFLIVGIPFVVVAERSVVALLVQIPVWVVAGLVFGLLMRLFLSRRAG